ncbi:MAG TPA: hypothetical protein IAB63_05975 [Candidatus Onthocola gallistercoris]|uniref:Glycosyltransferase RgtA/B/C/D-like domain-containing protein n=1 Tax=Candidatus Onthocola gallistercoris TaxID=2840876 RepID=A0A9D1HGZ5_9FIRM|nr:hypothetical protein [Candidatus Onthocola gallistercoris]
MNTRRDEIYESITRKQLIFLALAGGMIGCILFAFCYGLDVINVTNDGWLLSGGDLTQHYIGWKFFRNSDWHFPIGLMDGLVYPQQICIIFTDSIPLFALFFKLLSPILPETFQYFGLWGVLSYFLMGAVSAVILRKATKNPAICVAGSVFFSFSPYVIQRMFRHTALAGNWLILMAIAIWIYKPYFSGFKRKTIAWGLLLVTGSLVHIYYIPMIMVFMFFSCLQDLLEKKDWKADIVMGILVVAVDLTVLYCIGAFSSTTALADGGLGSYSSNLNTFWNPMGKGRFFSTRPTINPGQDEGYGYLGLGILILLVVAVIIWALHIFRDWKKENLSAGGSHTFSACMFLAALASVILAASPILSYNDKILVTLDYPDTIIQLLSIFRASGRFIWCACYIFMFFALMTVASHIRKEWAAFAGIALAACIQLLDLGAYAFNGGRQITMAYSRESILDAENWNGVLEGKQHLVFLPFNQLADTDNGSEIMYAFANLAVDHGMTVNYCIAARVDTDKVASDEDILKENLQTGNYDKSTVYILDSRETGESYHMNVQVIDGFIVGTY